MLQYETSGAMPILISKISRRRKKFQRTSNGALKTGQKLTDKYIAEVEAALKVKEQDLLCSSSLPSASLELTR